MNSKPLTYIIVMIVGSFLVSFAILSDFKSDPTQINSAFLTGIGLIIIPWLFAIFIDPILKFIKKYIFKKQSSKDVTISWLHNFIEDVMAYWIIIVIINIAVSFLRK